MTRPASQTVTGYTEAEVQRLADVMTRYAKEVHGASFRQDKAAQAQADFMTGIHSSGNAVLDWALIMNRTDAARLNHDVAAFVETIIREEVARRNEGKS